MTVSSRTNPPRVPARSTMSPGPVGWSSASPAGVPGAVGADDGELDSVAGLPVAAVAGDTVAAPGEAHAPRPSAAATTSTAVRAGSSGAFGMAPGRRDRRSGSHATIGRMVRDLHRPLREAWIVDAVRTPIGRYGGALASVRPDDLAALVVRAIVDRTGVDPSAIEDVVFGCSNGAGEDNRNVARMAVLLAGLPVVVAGQTVNRLC